MLELKDIRAKADDYLHQLSFASRVQDVAWVDGLYLGFEIFRTWWKDPSRKIDLEKLKVEDVLCTNETMRRLTSLGREEMPDAAGIAVFDYHPSAEDSEATLEGAHTREVVEDTEATPTTQDPLLFLRQFSLCTIFCNLLVHSKFL